MKQQASVCVLLLSVLMFSVFAQSSSPSTSTSSSTAPPPPATTVALTLSINSSVTPITPTTTTSTNNTAPDSNEDAPTTNTTSNGTTTASQSADSSNTTESSAAESTTNGTSSGSETTPGPGASETTSSSNATDATPVTTQNNTESPVEQNNTSPTTPSSAVPPTFTMQAPTKTSAAAATSPPPPTSPPPTHNATGVISETNLLLATDNFFVELTGNASTTLEGLTLVIFDGQTGAPKTVVRFTDQMFDSAGLFVQAINKTEVQGLTTVVVALYLTSSYNGTLTHEGCCNFTLLTQDPASVSDNVLQTLKLDRASLLVVSSSLTSSQSLGLSQCKQGQGMFVVVAPETRLKPNNCTLTRSDTQFSLQLHKSSGVCLTTADGSGDDSLSNQDVLKKQFVSDLGQLCTCGLASSLISGSLTCQKDLFFEFNIAESYPGLSERFAEAFRSYVNNASVISIGSSQYTVVNCTQKCRSSGTGHLPSSDKSKSSGVTVAVVLSCVAVFLIVLVFVILYMRGKRKGIMRQFRMTRLQEDDDMDDMDDFIGGGEPSFSSSRNNLTS